MIEPVASTAIRRDVALISRQALHDGVDAGTEINDKSVIPFMTGPPLSEQERRSWLPLQPGLGLLNRKCLEKCVRVVTGRMRNFRGHVLMRVHFGTMSLRAYKKPGDSHHTLDAFFAMLRLNRQTRGEVIRQ